MPVSVLEVAGVTNAQRPFLPGPSKVRPAKTEIARASCQKLQKNHRDLATISHLYLHGSINCNVLFHHLLIFTYHLNATSVILARELQLE